MVDVSILLSLTLSCASPDLSLDQRVEYMSRAVMCAKSCRQATTGETIGELLHELEEKMEVCVYMRPNQVETLLSPAAYSLVPHDD